MIINKRLKKIRCIKNSENSGRNAFVSFSEKQLKAVHPLSFIDDFMCTLIREVSTSSSFCRLITYQSAANSKQSP